MIDNDLKEGYIYTFKVGIVSDRNATAYGTFESVKGDTYLSKEEVETIYQGLEAEEGKVYSKQVSIDCQPTRDRLYMNESTEIKCHVKNVGNTYLKELEVCFDECLKLDLGISQGVDMTFTRSRSSIFH